MSVVQLQPTEGSYLGTVALWRMPDGEIRAQIYYMPAHVIEEDDGEPADRVLPPG